MTPFKEQLYDLLIFLNTNSPTRKFEEILLLSLMKVNYGVPNFLVDEILEHTFSTLVLDKQGSLYFTVGFKRKSESQNTLRSERGSHTLGL